MMSTAVFTLPSDKYFEKISVTIDGKEHACKQAKKEAREQASNQREYFSSANKCMLQFGIGRSI